MALRKIVTVGDPILTKKCRPVTKFDDRLATLLDDMFETMHDANGVGLAGPQVGILRRVVVVDTGEEDIELVNPEILHVSEETQTGLEGCLSLPGQYGIVTRPNSRAASVMRSTIWTGICTPRSRSGCSRRRSWRRS